MYVEIVGLETVLDAVNNFGRRVEAAAAAAAKAEADFELPLTQELVPVESGELQRSGRVEPVQVAGVTIAASIAYGGPAGSGAGQTKDVDYALKVHEDLEANHPHGGQAKFVSSVIQEEMESGRAASRMAQVIIARLGL